MVHLPIEYYYYFHRSVLITILSSCGVGTTDRDRKTQDKNNLVALTWCKIIKWRICDLLHKTVVPCNKLHIGH